jgi:hypothetical protein
MAPWLRTACAFIFAPVIGAIEVAAIQASIRPAGEGPTWFDSFAQWLIVASINSYLISYIAGTVTFIVLRMRRKESIRLYAAIGAIVGGSIGVFFLAIAVARATWMSILGVIVLALIGLSVAVTFAVIRGVPKRA